MTQLSADHIGTVSHGTMLSDHLAPTFLALLPGDHPLQLEYDRVTDAATALRTVGVDVDTDSYMEWLDELVQQLFDALDEIAPEGTTFGAHPGDGSDFGFWPFEDDASGDVAD